MAFTSPPNVLSLRSARTHVSLNNTSARFAVSRRPQTMAMPSAQDGSGARDSGPAEVWSTRILRASRLIGISAAGAVAASTLPPLVGRLGGRMSDTAALSVLNPVMTAEAAAKFSRKSLSEKLSQVPVFAVTNASGQPYLAKMDGSGSQIGLIFFSHLDALNMLKDMQKNPGASDARVYIMGLDKAYEMVKAKPTPSGIRGSSGEELTMVFRFYPDSRQVKAAEGLVRKLRLKQGVDGVPVFVAKGLTVRKGGENVIPLFLTKEDLDAAWSKLKDTNKDLPGSAQVVVGNLLFIIQQMENGEVPELQNVGFFPPRASVDYVSKEQAGPVGQARMHQNPIAQK